MPAVAVDCHPKLQLFDLLHVTNGHFVNVFHIVGQVGLNLSFVLVQSLLELADLGPKLHLLIVGDGYDVCFTATFSLCWLIHHLSISDLVVGILWKDELRNHVDDEGQEPKEECMRAA